MKAIKSFNYLEIMNLQAVNVNQFSAKMKSKKELYKFLLQDCQAYLPPKDSTNVYFFKQIMRGAKEVRIFSHLQYALVHPPGQDPCGRGATDRGPHRGEHA